MSRQKYCLVPLAVAIILSAECPTALSQSFTGPLAERDLREHAGILQAPYTALWLVPRPGAEDFRAIAALRATGGQPAIVYATNGEAAPTRNEEGPIVLAAGVRKEEADGACAALGGSAWFLNMPDEPGDWSRRISMKDPSFDEAVRSLAAAVRSFRPTVAVVGRDRNTGVGSAAEERALVELLRRAIGVAADPVQRVNGPLPMGASWKVAQVWSDAEQGPVMKPLPSTRRTDARMRANDGREWYRSYAGLLPDRPASHYVRISETGQPGRASLGADLRPYSRTLAPLAESIRKASAAAATGDATALAVVDRARNDLSLRLRSGGAAVLSEEDQRTLLMWKNELDLVKALLLKVPVRVTVSDSVMMDRQLFTVTVAGADSVSLPGSTGIVFHKPPGEEWIINVSKNRQFDLHKVREFRIITPDKNIPSYPVPEHGLDKTILREPFRFSIFHEEPTREKSFIINLDARLGFAPRLGTIIHTPVVCTDPAEPIVVEVRNYSRDGGRPSYIVTDTMCAGSGPQIDLPGKGSVAFDTVRISWFLPEDSLHADYPISLRSGQVNLVTIIGRPMGLKGDSTRRAGVLAPDAGIADRAVRRIRGLRIMGAGGMDADRLLDSCNVIVVDREASPLPAEGKLRGWVRGGGHAVILCESPGAWRWTSGRDSIWLDSRDPLSAGAGLEQTSGTTLPGLNPVTAKDLEGWPMYRSRTAVRWTSGFKPEILFQTGTTSLSL